MYNIYTKEASELLYKIGDLGGLGSSNFQRSSLKINEHTAYNTCKMQCKSILLYLYWQFSPNKIST